MSPSMRFVRTMFLINCKSSAKMTKVCRVVIETGVSTEGVASHGVGAAAVEENKPLSPFAPIRTLLLLILSNFFAISVNLSDFLTNSPCKTRLS